MSSVRKVLFENLNRSGLEGFSIGIKKCIQQGIVDSKDLKLFSQMTLDYIDKLSLSQTTSLLHSFSIPIYRNFQLFTSLTSRIRSLLENEPVSVEDSIKIINSCGRLHYSDSQLFPILLKVITNNIENIRTKNIVSILHSLTKLRYTDYDLLSFLCLIPLDKLDEISDIALANYSIAASKIYSVERTRFEKDSELLEDGKKVVSSLIPEIKSRCPVSSPLDNLRHIIALSNMKHLITDKEELNQCLEQLLKFLNCTVLYYEHLTILLECLVSLNYINTNFTYQILIPNLLNKRNESNSSFEVDLRLLKCFSSIEGGHYTNKNNNEDNAQQEEKNRDKDKDDYKEVKKNKENENEGKEEYNHISNNENNINSINININSNNNNKRDTNNTFDFFLDQILENLFKNIDKNPQYIGDVFCIINKIKNINPDRFLKSLQLYLEKESCYLDQDSINQIKDSINNSTNHWNDLLLLLDNGLENKINE